MNCPNCGLQITDPRLPSCPRCGQPLRAPMPDQQPQAGTPTYPGYGAPGFGAQPTTPPAASSFGDQTPYPGAGYGQPPAAPPAYGGDPYAGQPPAGAQSGYPAYGQPAAPSTPFYGQGMGQGMPGGYPMPQQPGYPMPQPPQRKRNLGLIIGIPVAVVLVLCIGGFAGLAYIGSRLPATSTSTSTNTGTSATSTPTEQVIFQDALTSSSHDGNWPNDSNCIFASDGYHVKGGYLCYAPTDDVSNGTISVNAKQTNGDITQGYGLVLRRASKGNYYIFVIDSNGKWAFYKLVNDSATAVKDFTASSAIHSGLNASNALKVTMSGSSFTFYVNDTQVGEATDSTFTSGLSGVAGADSSEVVYTSFKIIK